MLTNSRYLNNMNLKLTITKKKKKSYTHIKRQATLCWTEAGMEAPNTSNTSSNTCEVPCVVMKEGLPHQKTAPVHSTEKVQKINHSYKNSLFFQTINHTIISRTKTEIMRKWKEISFQYNTFQKFLFTTSLNINRISSFFQGRLWP